MIYHGAQESRVEEAPAASWLLYDIPFTLLKLLLRGKGVALVTVIPVHG